MHHTLGCDIYLSQHCLISWHYGHVFFFFVASKQYALFLMGQRFVLLKPCSKHNTYYIRNNQCVNQMLFLMALVVTFHPTFLLYILREINQ